MKKAILATSVVLMGLALSGCGVNTSGNIDVDAEDLRYTMDSRTDLCYAVVASRKTGSIDTTGLGLTNVPCTDEVQRLAE